MRDFRLVRGNIAAATGAPNAGTRSRGIASGVRNGAGDWTITMSAAVDVNRINVQVTPAGSTAVEVAAEVASSTTIRVRAVNNAAAATDVDFFIAVDLVD